MSAKPRILIVDDSSNLRLVIKRYLSAGVEADFYEAGNGEEALQVLQEGQVMDEPIDIVFLDWMMPHVSGFEFLKRIRETEAFKESPAVVMLTAETYSEQINACLKYGVAAYLTKPFTQDDVIRAVRQILEQKGLKHAV